MNLKYENQKYKQGYAHIIGCDEVGRGCLAGPVVAAAVAFAPASLKLKVKSYKEIRDSKLLSAKKREELAEIIKQHALWGVGVVDEKIIDKINIHNATLLAMRRAVESLPQSVVARFIEPNEPDKSGNYKQALFLFIDGKFTIPDFPVEQEAVVDGDNKIFCIAAASIIAKVYRDDLMCKLHKQYPVYNLEQHKGYATLYHRRMIMQHGLSEIHRVSFCQQLAPT
jgi:ribonuclease HII